MPGRSANEIVTDGSCPEWFTVSGPTSSLKLTTAFQRHERAARVVLNPRLVERIGVQLYWRVSSS